MSASAQKQRFRRDLKGEKRRRRIIDRLANGQADVPVQDLAESLGVSVSTIRRDLTDLRERQLITRTYGGAALSHPRPELSMPQRASSHAEAKQAIGAAAARLVADGDLIILDAGSTTEQVAIALGDRPVSVVSNGLRVITRLVAYEHVSVLVLGGGLRGFNETITGPDAEDMLSRVFARHAFLGTDAIDPVRGLASRSYAQARLKSLMMARAESVCVVADASKLTDGDFQYWSPLPPEWNLITDQQVDFSALRRARAAGALSITTA